MTIRVSEFDGEAVVVDRYPVPIMITRDDEGATFVVSMLAQYDRSYPKFVVHRIGSDAAAEVGQEDIQVALVNAGSPAGEIFEKPWRDLRFLVSYAQIGAMWKNDGDDALIATRGDYARDMLLLAYGRWEARREVAP